MKGLSRGRRVHRGHRDMPPARPPVVTGATQPVAGPAAWRGPPSPPASGRGAALHPHFISEARRFVLSLGAGRDVGTCRCLGRPRWPPDGAVAAESQGRRRPQGARPDTLRGAVWRWSHANPVWSRTDPRGFQRTTGKFVKSVFPERSGRGGFRSSALSTPFKSLRDKSKREL